MAYIIYTDTSTNLPVRMTEPFGVKVIPFSYIIDDVPYSCMDIEAFDGHGYYDSIRNGKKINTSQITPQLYIDNMEDDLKAGYDIIFISMSSGISGSYNSAEAAAKMLKEDYPESKILTVDTRCASLAEGIVVRRAIELKAQGMEIEELQKELLDLSERVYQVFTVDDLMHLMRTGRVSNVTAVVGTLLNIKPLLKGNELGQIVQLGKVRGRAKSLQGVADKYAELVCNPEEQTVYIAHTDCYDDAKKLADLLNEKRPPKEIEIVMYEPVTGAHVGPGAVALFFVASKGDRSR